MEINLHSLDDVRDFVAALNPELILAAHPQLRRDPAVTVDVRNVVTGLSATAIDEWAEAHFSHDAHPEGFEPAPAVKDEPTEAAGPDIPSQTEPGLARDADNVPYSTDWHSTPEKINADGRWKAKRNRDADAYAVWVAAHLVVAPSPEDEPLATETHALPQSAHPMDTGELPQDEPATVGLGVDHAALIAASQEAAMDASDSLQDLLVAGRDFITAHSTAAFNALKSAVVPLEGNPAGKPMQTLAPAERRLLRACMDNYPLFV